MNKFTPTLVLLMFLPLTAPGQTADHPYRAEGYAFAAYDATVGPSGGGGGEVLLYKRLGVGGEFVQAESFFRSTPFLHYTFGESITTMNAFYVAPSSKEHKFEPFVTGGYSFFHAPASGISQPGGLNIGAGANFWLAKHAALRLEFRATHGGHTERLDGDSGYPVPPSVVSQNIFSFRIGVTFR